jgi:hypothetical protein
MGMIARGSDHRFLERMGILLATSDQRGGSGVCSDKVADLYRYTLGVAQALWTPCPDSVSDGFNSLRASVMLTRQTPANLHLHLQARKLLISNT